MARSGIESLIVPFMDLLMLGRRAVVLRFALAKIELRLRANSIVTAVLLVLIALVLMVIMLVLLVQAAVLGLTALGFTPLHALLIAAALCGLIAVILALIARASLRRATLPLTSLAGAGEDLPATRP